MKERYRRSFIPAAVKTVQPALLAVKLAELTHNTYSTVFSIYLHILIYFVYILYILTTYFFGLHRLSLYALLLCGTLNALATSKHSAAVILEFPKYGSHK